MIIFLSPEKISAQAITRFFGYNAWLSDLQQGTGAGCESYLGNNHFDNVGNSSSINGQMVRYGGTYYDLNWPNLTDLGNAVSASKLAGLEPVVQVPILKGVIDYFAANSGSGVTVDQAIAALISYSGYNTTMASMVSTLKSDVKYWSIGNEPDNWASQFGDSNSPDFIDSRFLTNAITSAGIAQYIRYYAEQIRIWDNVGVQEFICGPEFAWSNFTASSSCKFMELSGGVTGQDIWTPTTISQGDNVDIFTFHKYGFLGGASQGWTRQQVIDQPYVGSSTFNDDLDDMQTWLAANNGYGYGKLGITEFNVCVFNDPDGSGTYVASTDNPISGVAANSFLAGQYFAEICAVGRYHQQWWWDFVMILPWSLKEGLGMTDHGMLNGPYTGYDRRSSFHHYKIMSNEFALGRLDFLTNAASYTNFKAFAVRSCTGSAVMIMDQRTSGLPQSYNIRFDGLPNTAAAFHVGNINMEWDHSIDFAQTNALGSIGPEETHVYILDACANIIRTYKYSAALNDPSYLDPTLGGPWSVVCRCNLADQAGEWYDMGETPYRIANPYPVAIDKNENSLIYVSSHPNPAQSQVTIYGKIGSNSATFRLFNASGIQVHGKEINSSSFSFELSLNNLTDGIYFYSITDDQGYIVNKKLLISK